MDLCTLYSCFGKSVYWKVESAGELELDLCSIVEWGVRWLVTFNVTKTKLLSFNCLACPFLNPLPCMLQGKWAPFIGPRVSLLLNPSCICTNLPFGHAWFMVPISGVVLQGPMGLIFQVECRNQQSAQQALCWLNDMLMVIKFLTSKYF